MIAGRFSNMTVRPGGCSNIGRVAPRWLNDAERNAWRNLSLMLFQLNAFLGRELVPTGLSYQDYLVLAVLSDREDHRERLGEVSRELGWEKSRLSHHVNRMAKRGLVTKVPCDTDRRGSFVVMTEEGHDAIRRAAPDHVEAVREYFIDLLTAEQVAELDSIARTVLDHLPAT